MISEDRLEKAVRYIAESDEEAATLFADMERCEFKAKATKDTLIAHGEGGLGERTAAAGCSPLYMDAMSSYFEAAQKYHAVKNKRATEALIVDVWRTLQANRRQG